MFSKISKHYKVSPPLSKLAVGSHSLAATHSQLQETENNEWSEIHKWGEEKAIKPKVKPNPNISGGNRKEGSDERLTIF